MIFGSLKEILYEVLQVEQPSRVCSNFCNFIQRISAKPETSLSLYNLVPLFEILLKSEHKTAKKCHPPVGTTSTVATHPYVCMYISCRLRT